MCFFLYPGCTDPEDVPDEYLIGSNRTNKFWSKLMCRKCVKEQESPPLTDNIWGIVDKVHVGDRNTTSAGGGWG